VVGRGGAALGSVGVVLGDERAHETKGMRTVDALEYWYRKFPWSGKSIDELAPEVHQRVIEIMAEHAQPLPGVVELVQFCAIAAKAAQMKVVVVSNGPDSVPGTWGTEVRKAATGSEEINGEGGSSGQVAGVPVGTDI